MAKKILFSFLLSLIIYSTSSAQCVRIVFSSDAHFGITRRGFQGDSDVNAVLVNTKMISCINTLPASVLPSDGGVLAGREVGAVDYFIQSGDIANRQEIPYQCAGSSWDQFTAVYLQGLKTHNQSGGPTTFLLAPGNHDVSNAIGYYKKLQPACDPSSLVGIYNLMLHPAIPKTKETYNYWKDPIHYSKDIGGVHFMFISIWPDSVGRIWMEQDLQPVPANRPVVIVAHDPPDGDAAHFTNPYGNNDINATDRFENLLAEHWKDLPPSAAKRDARPSNDTIEQQGFARFLKAHPNVKAYFHGHNNWNEFYTYRGPSGDLALPVFRVDSPMKGKFSSKDEKKLSFQLITIDSQTKKMTVRECLWNTDPTGSGNTLTWGNSITVAL